MTPGTYASKFAMPFFLLETDRKWLKIDKRFLAATQIHIWSYMNTLPRFGLFMKAQMSVCHSMKTHIIIPHGLLTKIK